MNFPMQAVFMHAFKHYYALSYNPLFWREGCLQGMLVS